MSEQRRKLGKRIRESKKYRDHLTQAESGNRVSFQIKSMLEDRGWSQQEIVRRSGIPQPVMSKYMNGYDAYSIKTLLKLASAFDVHLVVGFEPYSNLVDWMADMTPQSLAVPPTERDTRLWNDAEVPISPSATTGLGLGIGETITYTRSTDMVSTTPGKVVDITEARERYRWKDETPLGMEVGQ